MLCWIWSLSWEHWAKGGVPVHRQDRTHSYSYAQFSLANTSAGMFLNSKNMFRNSTHTVTWACNQIGDLWDSNATHCIAMPPRLYNINQKWKHHSPIQGKVQYRYLYLWVWMHLLVCFGEETKDPYNTWLTRCLVVRGSDNGSVLLTEMLLFETSACQKVIVGPFNCLLCKTVWTEVSKRWVK